MCFIVHLEKMTYMTTTDKNQFLRRSEWKQCTIVIKILAGVD